jgi:spermidine synthase
MPRLPVWDWMTNRKSPYEACKYAVRKRIVSCRTKFQDVAILDTYAFGRVLLLDHAIQSSEVDEFIYHEVLVHPVLCAAPGEALSVLIIGGGEGATLREVLRHKRVRHAVMVDIDEEVVELCRKHLPGWSQGAFDDRRATIVYDDGRAYLEVTDRIFDVIICDLTEPYPPSEATELYRRDFFRLIDGHLKETGLFCTQGSSASVQDMKLFTLLFSTLKSVFKLVRPMHAYVPSYGTEYGFLCASRGTDPMALTKSCLHKKLKREITGTLGFYDDSIHRTLFILPPFLKKAIASCDDIIA